MLKRILNLFKAGKTKSKRSEQEKRRKEIGEIYESAARDAGFRRDANYKMCKVTESDSGITVSFNKEQGMVNGKYYTEYTEEIKNLKKVKKHDEAIWLLLKILDAIERESREFDDGVSPWYYEQLAIIYRKEKRVADEIKVLERFAAQKKSPGVKPKKLAEQLAKAKEINPKN